MSLQDDYFDLDEYLKGGNEKRKAMRKAFNNIWEAFCELEGEVDKLREFRCSFRNMLSLIQESE